MESMNLGGKNYISSKRAAEVMGYTQDYIGQLARSGKIDAERISGSWYISEDEFVQKKDTDSLSSNVSAIPSSNEKTNKINTKKARDGVIYEGVRYISSKRAAEVMGYTQDYIGQLARSEKIEARQIGRSWYIAERATQNLSTESSQKDSSDTEVVQKEEEKSSRVVFQKEPEEIDVEKKETSAVECHSQESEISQDNAMVSTLLREHLHKEKEFNLPRVLYTEDTAPLLPSLYRTSRPTLHEILHNEEKIEAQNSVRSHDFLDIAHTKASKEVLLERGVRKEQEHASSKQGDILLLKRTRFPLLRAGFVSLLIVLSAISLNVAPQVISFSAEGVTFTAQAVSFTQDIPFLEKSTAFFMDLFAETLHYKVK